MTRTWIFIVLLFLGIVGTSHESFGQIIPEKIKHQTTIPELCGSISDTTRLGVIPLAHIFIMDGKDTVKLVSDLTGRFYYNGRFTDTMQIQVSALGFKPFSGLYIPKKHGLSIRILLQQASVELSEVIVTAKKIMMVVKGDTVQYNTDMVKTLQGSKMGEILKKLPGVSMDGGLKVNGVPIQRIYVNGDTLFKGIDALDHIDADNVKDVKVFDERNKEDLAQGLRHGRREKVMDVTTKREVNRNEIAKIGQQKKRNSLIIGGGVDASQKRTSEFPEKLSLNYAYIVGNVRSSGKSQTGIFRPSGRIQNGILFSVDYSNLFLNDKREFGGEFIYAKKFRKISYKTENFYRNMTTYQNQWEEQNYFPTDWYDSRYYEQTSSEKNMLYKYATSQEIWFRIGEVDFKLGGMYSYNVDKNWKNNRMLSTMNDKPMNSSDVRDFNRNDAIKGQTLFLISTNSKKKNVLQVSSELNFIKGGREGWQVDTAETSNRQIRLDRDWDNNQISWNTNFDFSSVISPMFKLFLKGRYYYGENSSKGLGENLLTGSLDTNNTRNYTFYNSSCNVDGTLTYYGKRVAISGGGSITHRMRNQVERFPVREQTKDHFLFFDPKLGMKATFSSTLNLSANYHMQTQLPSAVELRTEIDDMNPLYLKGGNPNLKPEKKHGLLIECNKLLPPSSALRTSLYVSLTQNPIVSSSRYFTETTYLPEYDYTVERGATLDTYENSDPLYYLSLGIGYDRFWHFLGKCIFDIKFSRRKEPSFAQGERNDLTQDEGELNLTIFTNFSKKIKLTITSRTRLERSDSRLDQANEFLQEWMTLETETRIIPKFFIQASLKYTYNKNFTTHDKTNETILNASISRGLGKNLSLSLNGENLLDSKHSNWIGRTAQYDYRRSQNQTGRYVTMKLSCRF